MAMHNYMSPYKVLMQLDIKYQDNVSTEKQTEPDRLDIHQD